MEYVVTYQFNKENDLWKTNKFTNKERAEEYYNRRLNQGYKVYFSTIPIYKNDIDAFSHIISLSNLLFAREFTETKDLVAIQFMKGNEQQYYILKNRMGKYDVILSSFDIRDFMLEARTINIININNLSEDSRKILIERIKDEYLKTIDIH